MSSTKGSKVESSAGKRKRKSNSQFVWVAIHQLEGSHRCVGDFSGSMGKNLSHRPKTFDSKILGIFTTKDAANQCAHDKWESLGLPEEDDSDEESEHDEEDEEENEDENGDEEGQSEGSGGESDANDAFDFEGDGKFYDGADSGYTTVFSQRVFIKKQVLHQE